MAAQAGSCMSSSYQTEQEVFWATTFGDEYISRNISDQLLASNISFFAKILNSAGRLNSVLELGANVGMNLKALRALLPDAQLAGIEINEKAYNELASHSWIKAYHGSIFDFQPSTQSDLVFFKGVLIHLNPEMLEKAYEVAYQASAKYVLFAEYYNPSPVSIPYREHKDKLFKRDFAGEIMEKYSNLKLVDYGFAYRRDPLFPQDDITWFLMEKKND
jgi:pseudaminic acid biosynthesis-associated methylase